MGMSTLNDSKSSISIIRKRKNQPEPMTEEEFKINRKLLEEIRRKREEKSMVGTCESQTNIS